MRCGYKQALTASTCGSEPATSWLWYRTALRTQPVPAGDNYRLVIFSVVRPPLTRPPPPAKPPFCPSSTSTATAGTTQTDNAAKCQALKPRLAKFNGRNMKPSASTTLDRFLPTSSMTYDSSIQKQPAKRNYLQTGPPQTQTAFGVAASTLRTLLARSPALPLPLMQIRPELSASTSPNVVHVPKSAPRLSVRRFREFNPRGQSIPTAS